MKSAAHLELIQSTFGPKLAFRPARAIAPASNLTKTN